MITRLVDIMIPRDETPGGVDLGIDQRVIRELRADRSLAKAYAWALLAIDEEARKNTMLRFSPWMTQPSATTPS